MAETRVSFFVARLSAFDPATLTWTAWTSAVPDVNNRRSGMSMAASTDGTSLFVFGGQTVEGMRMQT
eukprot:3058331-Rhodomonas_salina.2